MARIGNRRHGALGEVERQNALFEERVKNVPSHNNLRLYLIGSSSNVQYLGFCTAATNRWWCDNNKCPISFLYTFELDKLFATHVIDGSKRVANA